MRKHGAENWINSQFCMAARARDVEVLAVLLRHARILRLFTRNGHDKQSAKQEQRTQKNRGHSLRAPAVLRIRFSRDLATKNSSLITGGSCLGGIFAARESRR